MANKFIPIAMVLFCALLGAIAQIFFKTGSKQLSFSWQVFTNWPLMFGIFLYFISMLIYLVALRQMEVSRLYPFIASSYIWAAILASFFLGERLSAPTIIGISFVVVGISFLAWQ